MISGKWAPSGDATGTSSTDRQEGTRRKLAPAEHLRRRGATEVSTVMTNSNCYLMIERCVLIAIFNSNCPNLAKAD